MKHRTFRTGRSEAPRSIVLYNTAPGTWRTVDGDLFQYLGHARLGPAGARYRVEKWSAPHVDRTFTSLQAGLNAWDRARSRPPQEETDHATKKVPTLKKKVPAPKKLTSQEAIATVRRLLGPTGFDEEEHEGNRLLFSSREDGDIVEGRADPDLVRFARAQAAAVEAAVPGAQARVDVVDEWVSINVLLPGSPATPPPAEVPAPVERRVERTLGSPRASRSLRPGDEVKYTSFTVGGSREGTAIVTWDHGKSVEARALSGEKLRLERAPDGSLRRFT